MKLYCDKCGTLVAYIVPESKIKRGTAHICRDCAKSKSSSNIPDFLRNIMGGRCG